MVKIFLNNIINDFTKNRYQSKALIFLVIALFVTIKLAGDSLFYLIDKFDSKASIIWRIISSILILFPVCYYYFKNFYSKTDNISNKGVQSFFSNILQLIIFSFVAIFFTALLPNSLRFGGKIINLLSLFYVESVAILTCFLGFYLLRFLYKWFWIYKHKETKTYLNIISISIFILIIFDIFLQFRQFFSDEIPGKDIITYIIRFVEIALFLIVLFGTKKNSWIASLSRNQKWQLIFYSLLLILISIGIISNTVERNGNGRLFNALLLLFGSYPIIVVPCNLLIAYFLRLMISAIAGLPTTYIMERRITEISSLTYLNRLVAQSIDFNELITTVTQLSMYSSNARFAWSELYNQDGSFEIKSSFNLNAQQLEFIEKHDDLRNLFKHLNELLFIESIPDFKKSNPVFREFNFAKSMIAIPLHAGEERIGTLVVLHTEEYGFESDYLNVLLAFSYNVNIAIENSRLLQESLEKERYKKELILAKDIQNKLLPQSIPSIRNFNISAFSLPAEEVGGDYYDFVYLKNKKPCILIGDVSGKGMSAAFYMIMLKGSVISLANESESARELLIKINNALYKSMEKQIFITLTALVIENDEGDISIARAGHMPVLIKNNGPVNTFVPKGLGLGLTDSITFSKNLEEINIKMQSKNICLLYTDGIVESGKPNVNELDINNLKQILNSDVYNNVDELLENILKEMKEIRGNESYSDDMTLVALSFDGKFGTKIVN